MVFAETAHPAKFGDAITRHTGIEPPMPERLAAFAERTVSAQPIDSEYETFHGFLRSRFQS